MKSIALSFAILVSVVSLFTASIVMARTMSSKQTQIRRVDHYEHPCIVLQVDNYGCQAEVEIRRGKRVD